MRTRLFHTIVLFGAALGASACSGDGDESDETRQESSVGGSGSEGSGGSSGDASGGASATGSGGVHTAGSGGWPPTK